MSDLKPGEIRRVDIGPDEWTKDMTAKLVEQNALILKVNADLLQMLSRGSFVYYAPTVGK